MLAQILFIIGSIISIPLLPFLIYQGKQVRKKVPSLPEADPPNQGRIGSGASHLNLLTLGESTIAGVGVKTHQFGITGHLAKALNQQVNGAVDWEVIAKSGYRAKEVRDMLVPKITNKNYDLIVIGLGGNDTFQMTTPWRWREEFIRLLQALRQKQPTSKIVIANMPPIGQFPAFPWIVQLVLGNLVKLHGMALRDVPQQFQHVYYIDKAIRFENWLTQTSENAKVDDFFSDGVHPSALAYELWAKEIAVFIDQQNILSK